MDRLKYIKLENEDGSYSSSIPLAVDSNYVDVNGNTLTNVLDNKANNAAVSNLQSQVNGLASGSPAGVYATVAALTTADPNHDKIYVVTENGHWYYYSNNQWNDGGTYQATEIENDSVTPDKTSFLKYENGDLFNIPFSSKLQATNFSAFTGWAFPFLKSQITEKIYKIKVRICTNTDNTEVVCSIRDYNNINTIIKSDTKTIATATGNAYVSDGQLITFDLPFDANDIPNDKFYISFKTTDTSKQILMIDLFEDVSNKPYFKDVMNLNFKYFTTSVWATVTGGDDMKKLWFSLLTREYLDIMYEDDDYINDIIDTIDDISNGYEDFNYDTPGDSVRNQIEKLNNDINSVDIYSILKNTNNITTEYYNDIIKFKYNGLQWRYVDTIIHLPAGNHTLIVNNAKMSSVGYFRIGKTLISPDILPEQTTPGIYPFKIDEERDIHLLFQISLGTSLEEEIGEYFYLSKVSIVSGYYTKEKLFNMIKYLNNLTPYGQITSANSLSDGENLSLSVSNSKQNNTITFNSRVTTFNEIIISNGKTQPWGSAYAKIDNTNVKVYTYYSTETLLNTYSHNLTISDLLNVIIKVKDDFKADLIVTTRNGVFTQEISWIGCKGDIKVESNGSTLSNCILSFSCKDYSKDIWAFGDSYFDMWTPIVNQYGYTNYMMDGFSGRGSVAALASLNKCLNYNIPKKIIWCLGMNDHDSNNTLNTNWKNTVKEVMRICDEYGVELILATIPTTPLYDNSLKNNYIYNSGYRYVDIAKAVGSDLNSNWFTGLLSTDNVHPTAMGSKVIAAAVINGVPELMCK